PARASLTTGSSTLKPIPSKPSPFPAKHSPAKPWAARMTLSKPHLSPPSRSPSPNSGRRLRRSRGSESLQKAPHPFHVLRLEHAQVAIKIFFRVDRTCDGVPVFREAVDLALRDAGALERLGEFAGAGIGQEAGEFWLVGRRLLEKEHKAP